MAQSLSAQFMSAVFVFEATAVLYSACSGFLY